MNRFNGRNGYGNLDCPKCHGIGYISYDVPMGDARFGRIFDCECLAQQSEAISVRLRRAGLADPETVVARAMDWDMAGREEMAAGVRAFVQRMMRDERGGQMVLASPYGCGKTALAEWAVWQCCAAGKDAIYVSAEAFKRAVSDMIGMGDVTSRMIDRVRSASIVVMDQIDWIREQVAGGHQSYTAEVFRDLFDARYRQRRELATVYLVNLDAWERGGNGALDAIYDRMKEGEVLVMRSQGVRAQLGRAA